MSSINDNLAVTLSQFPHLLIAIGIAVCSILAFTKRATLGSKASALAGTGLALGALGRLASFGYLMFINEIFRFDDRMSIIALANIGFSLLDVVSLGLIIAAIFVRRPALPPAPY